MTDRAVIADDERLMREQLRARLAEVWPELRSSAEAKNGAEAVALVDAAPARHRLPRHPHAGHDRRRGGARDRPAAVDDDDASAADAAGQPWRGSEIVFITAYDQYAIEAFEQGVVDYVLKPAERERLQLTVERIKKRLASAQRRRAAPTRAGMQQLLQKLAAKMNPAAAPRLKWIQATVGASIQMIPVEDVLFFISDEKYTRVQTATLEALIRKPIKELSTSSTPSQFWQIHRSTLVNTRMIAGVTRDLRGRQLVAVRGHPEKLEVSRSYAGLFKGM